MRSNMFDDEYDDGYDEDDDLENMSMDEFLEYLYEHRSHFFGEMDFNDLEYGMPENAEEMNKYIKMPIDFCYQFIGNREYLIASAYGDWVVFNN